VCRSSCTSPVTRRCSTCSASDWGSPAPRKAATRAPAARAPFWSTASAIEGLAGDGELHPLQAAFVRHDALQCGYCTPGQIISAVALLAEGRAGSDKEISEFMSGNLCRCAAYPNIVSAIREVAGR
jgi:xanthine dehydrogenase YagT iron-sulfur-binding subunit